MFFQLDFLLHFQPSSSSSCRGFSRLPLGVTVGDRGTRTHTRTQAAAGYGPGAAGGCCYLTKAQGGLCGVLSSLPDGLNVMIGGASHLSQPRRLNNNAEYPRIYGYIRELRDGGARDEIIISFCSVQANHATRAF